MTLICWEGWVFGNKAEQIWGKGHPLRCDRYGRFAQNKSRPKKFSFFLLTALLCCSLYSSSLSLSVVQVASRVLVTAAADASVCLTLSHPLPLSANGCYTAVTIIYFVTACLCKEFPSHHRLLVVGVRKHISSKSNFPNWQNFPFLARLGKKKPFRLTHHSLSHPMAI